MAINLNPGADATLVSAAWRAGVATAPADYSKTFENVAKSYEKTMEAQAEMWKDIGDVVGVIGADMVANANEFMDYSIKAAGLNPDSVKVLVNELDANKQAQLDLGFGAGLFGDKETRQRKRELKLEQAELFAEIDMAAESINAGAEAIAAGLYDHELAPQDAEMINAIIKSNLKDKITEVGYQAVLSRDEKTDQLMFSLLDENGKAVTSDATGEPITMTMKEFNKSIATNVKDTKNVIGNAMGTIENDIATAGQTSKSGVIDEQALQFSLNRLDGLLQTDTDIKRAMLAKYGYSGTSFADDIKTKGKVSEEIYASLIRTIGATEDGQVIAGGVFGDIADTDDKKGLSQEEIEKAYATYSTNILGMKDPEVSKAVLKASFADRMRESHKYGYSNRAPGVDDGKNPFGLATKNVFNSKYGGWVSNAERQRQRNFVETNTSFNGLGGSYDYNTTTKTWTLTDASGEPKPITTYDILKDENLLIAGDKPMVSKNKKDLTEPQMLKPFFGLKEGEGAKALASILPSGYSFKEVGWDIMGRDALDIYDENDKLIDRFQFDYDNPVKQSKEAKRFWEMFKGNDASGNPYLDPQSWALNPYFQ